MLIEPHSLEENKMELKYIETTHTTYLATEIFESVYAVHLKGAFVPESDTIGCPDSIARNYARKKLTGKLFDFHIPRSELESICDAMQESNTASELCNKAKLQLI